jgi:hypothetical protein
MEKTPNISFNTTKDFRKKSTNGWVGGSHFYPSYPGSRDWKGYGSRLDWAKS